MYYFFVSKNLDVKERPAMDTPNQNQENELSMRERYIQEHEKRLELNEKYLELKNKYINLKIKYKELMDNYTKLVAELDAEKELNTKREAFFNEQISALKKDLGSMKEYLSSHASDFNLENTKKTISNIERSSANREEIDKQVDGAKRFLAILHTDTDTKPHGPMAAQQDFMQMMARAYNDEPTSKGYVIKAAQEAINKGYLPKTVTAMINRFAPEAVNHPDGEYARWVMSKIDVRKQSKSFSK